MIERTYSGNPPKIKLPKGTIDTQAHLYLPGFKAEQGGPALPEGLPDINEYQQVMAWLGIERVVVTQGNAHQLNNANLLAVLAEISSFARGVAVIDESSTDRELEKLANQGICGARIMDLPGGAVGLDKLEMVDRKASSMDWMMAVQFDGSDIDKHFARLGAIQSRWVFDHHGKFFKGAKINGKEVDLVKKLIDKGNCWFKFSGCYESSLSGGPDYQDIAEIAKVIASYAPERIVWGTNFPHNMMLSTEDYPNDAALLDTVLGWLPNEHSRHLALVENPQTLYKF